MKVILLKDIPRMGRKHEVKEVPDGHAQNYLIPRKLVIPATAQNIKWQSEHAARRENEEVAATEQFAKFLAHVEDNPVTISTTANAQGHLFKGLRATDIAKALSDATGSTIEASAIDLLRPIKEVGEAEITVTMGGKRGKVSIIVKAT